MKILIWGIALLVAILATLAVFVILGLAAAFLGNSFSIAVFDESVVNRYQALFWLTAVAGIVASLARLVILLRNRAKHSLRITEYIEHVIFAGSLAAGLFYGASALTIAVLRELTDDSVSDEVIRSVFLYALIPITMVFLAVVIAVSDHVEKIPNSRELSSSEKRCIHQCRQLRSLVNFAKQMAKQTIRRKSPD